MMTFPGSHSMCSDRMLEVSSISLTRLFKLRLAVGRFGEMDGARWWNTQGVLGSRGANVYKRGLPRTHLFARSRVVAAVARDRSATVYNAPGVATLWDLPASLERALSFEERSWASTEEGRTAWDHFEETIAAPPGEDLLGWLINLELVDPDIRTSCSALKPEPGGKGIPVEGPMSVQTVQLLAAAHSHGRPKELVVPFVPEGLEVALG